MNFVYLSASTVAPTDPALKPGLDVNAVTPGTIGFIFTLVMAVAVILLAVDMSRRIRRVRYQAQLRGEVIEPAGIPVDPRRGGPDAEGVEAEEAGDLEAEGRTIAGLDAGDLDPRGPRADGRDAGGSGGRPDRSGPTG